MEFFASDAMNGRASGSRDEWITATYIASHLRRWGLEPLGDDGGYVQTIAIERPELGSAPVLSAGGRRYVHGKEITVASMSAPRVSGSLTRHQQGTAVPPGAALLLPEFTRDMAEAVGPAALLLTRPNGCGPVRSQRGVAAASRSAHRRRAAGRRSALVRDARRRHLHRHGERAGRHNGFPRG